MTVDDFESGELGEGWTHTYRGFGLRSDAGDAAWVSPTFQSVSAQICALPAPDGRGWDFYGSMPNTSGQHVGAKLRHDTTCKGCGKRFAKGDCVTAKLAPNLGGAWRHTDCGDPKLEREIGEQPTDAPR